MPNLANVADVLRRYGGRYKFLDAFADDVDELRPGVWDPRQAAQAGPAEVAIETGSGRVLMQLFPEQGIARFRLVDEGTARGIDEHMAVGAVIGGLVGTAVSSASKAKEGLLGGLIVGMLVGGFVGATAQPVERVLALKFEPGSGDWQVYDGPLLRWAKRALHPAVPAA